MGVMPIGRVQRNEFGEFLLEPPPWLTELRRRSDVLVRLEEAVWRRSLKIGFSPPWDRVEKLFRPVREAREHSLLVYQSADGRSLRFNTAYKGARNPRTGKFDRIVFPRTGLPAVPGHKLIVVERTHPEEYRFESYPGHHYVRGPSDVDQCLARLRPDVLYVIQALTPTFHERQWIYYGQVALRRPGSAIPCPTDQAPAMGRPRRA